MKITLPFELTNGNDGRGSKWFSSAKIRTTYPQTFWMDGIQPPLSGVE